MEYNNYYPAQAGHPPPNVTNQQHGGPQALPPPGAQMMHAPMNPQNNRQAMPPGPSSHHQQQQQIQQMQQQQQQQQHLGQHSQQMPSQQHPNYHQIQQPHPHGPPVTHSGSPHPQQQQQSQQHHNHQPNIAGPPSQQHHMHPHSPHHGGPPMHIQQQQQQQQQMARPPIGPSVMNYPQGGLQQPPIHQSQNFFNGGPAPQHNMHHYPQQNQHHHPHHQSQHHHQHHHQPPMMHHAPPPMASNHQHHHHHIQHQAIGRNSPYFPNILQTEIRIIELNRRLQARPISLQAPSPLPSNSYDESQWWERFASDFFEDDATLTIRIQDDKPIDYTIGRTLIPRYFRTYFDGGITDLSINLCNPKEACIPPNSITLDCDRAFIITNHIFRHPALMAPVPNQGVVVHTEGHLTLEFVNNFDTLSIKSWRFQAKSCREYIDRVLTTMGLPTPFLAEPITRQGLTKSTINYLKMCMVMEPMQDLMFQNRQTKMDPRSCLRKLLFDRYKYRGAEDNRVPTNKRRKRKPSAAPAITGATTNKKSKANINNTMGNNSSLNNNIILSPSGGPGFPLASESVMIVGEPSMMGGDFGDDNERMITRLENTQYDPTASTPSNPEDIDNITTPGGNDSTTINKNGNNDPSMKTHSVPSPLTQPRQPLQLQPQTSGSTTTQGVPQMNPAEVPTQEPENPNKPLELLENLQEQVDDELPADLGQINQVTPIEQPEVQLQESNQHQQSPEKNEPEQQLLLPQPEPIHVQEQQSEEEAIEVPPLANDDELSRNKTADLIDDHDQPARMDLSNHPIPSETKLSSLIVPASETNLITDVNSIQQMDNHTNSISMNEESNSNSQLPCSTTNATATSALEQQPVDNGVA